MKVELTFGDRLYLLMSVPPQEGNFVTIKTIREIRQKIEFSEEEILKYEIKSEADTVSWKENVEQEYEFGEVAVGIIMSAFKKIDDDGKVTIQMIPLFDKFGYTS